VCCARCAVVGRLGAATGRNVLPDTHGAISSSSYISETLSSSNWEPVRMAPAPWPAPRLVSSGELQEESSDSSNRKAEEEQDAEPPSEAVRSVQVGGGRAVGWTVPCCLSARWQGS